MWGCYRTHIWLWFWGHATRLLCWCGCWRCPPWGNGVIQNFPFFFPFSKQQPRTCFDSEPKLKQQNFSFQDHKNELICYFYCNCIFFFKLLIHLRLKEGFFIVFISVKTTQTALAFIFFCHHFPWNVIVCICQCVNKLLLLYNFSDFSFFPGFLLLPFQSNARYISHKK